MSITVTQHTVNNRILTRFAPLNNELTYAPEKNYLFELDYLTALTLQGEKSAEFLQGQISCDVHEVSNNQIRQGALCNLKGRVLALLDVINWNGLHLTLPNDIASATQALLSKPAMFSRVKVNLSQHYRLFGFYLQNTNDLIPLNLELPNQNHGLSYNDVACIYSLAPNLYILLVSNDDVEKLISPFAASSQWKGSLAWHVLQLTHAHIEIYPESRGLFLPHRLNLHEEGYLNFDKGCYKGQEVIARMHYRAKLKHKMQLFKIQTNQSLTSGDKIFAADSSKEVGDLIDFCPLGENKWLIAASILIDFPQEVQLNEEKVRLEQLNIPL